MKTVHFPILVHTIYLTDKSWRWLPLLELCRGYKGSAQVTVAHFLGLPPGGVLLADNLKNIPPLKRKSCLLARCSFVLIGCIVKQCPQVDLYGAGILCHQRKTWWRGFIFWKYTNVSWCMLDQRIEFCVDNLTDKTFTPTSAVYYQKINQLNRLRFPFFVVLTLSKANSLERIL